MITRAALLGLGTMGPGIAARLARGGITVSAFDPAAGARERTPALVGEAHAVLDRLRIAPGTATVGVHDSIEAALDGAELVVENVPETMAVKAEFYRRLGRLVPPETIVASDTSGIPIGTLASHYAYPGRVVGMHWSNPPHIIPMIEVIAGPQTEPGVATAIEDLVRALGLLPVRVKRDVPGFVENRILYALLREAIDLVENDVIDAADLDTCVSWGIGYKLGVIGPMALLDMAGLDIYRSVAGMLNAELSTRSDVAPMIEKLVAAGRLGIKSGAGLHDYPPERVASLRAERAAKLVAARLALEGRA